MDFAMISAITASILNQPPDGEAKCSHELWIGDRALAMFPTRLALGLFRGLSGDGIHPEDFPTYLRGVSQQLFGDPKAIDVGASLKFIRSNGEVQMAAVVGGALARIPVAEMALA